MIKEVFISGYCRVQDQSRMVEVEVDGTQVEADCCYGSCAYEQNCTVAARIRELESGE